MVPDHSRTFPKRFSVLLVHSFSGVDIGLLRMLNIHSEIPERLLKHSATLQELYYIYKPSGIWNILTILKLLESFQNILQYFWTILQYFPTLHRILWPFFKLFGSIFLGFLNTHSWNFGKTFRIFQNSIQRSSVLLGHSYEYPTLARLNWEEALR